MKERHPDIGGANDSYPELPDDYKYTVTFYLKNGGTFRYWTSKVSAIREAEEWADFVKARHLGESRPFGFIGGLGWGVMLEEVVGVFIQPKEMSQTWWERFWVK